MRTGVKDHIRNHLPDFPMARVSGRVYTDTTDFMRIDYGDLIDLGESQYLVLKDEVERSYGLEDPKYWVKRCIHLQSGHRKILKLVFHESFPVSIGSYQITCYRSPMKEARILKLVQGDSRFMQGESVKDENGNVVRVLEVIRGRRLDEVVDRISADHFTYFTRHFPDILHNFIGSCEAIGFLHANWEKHGDIRRDHLWVESGTGAYRWIDFDYTYEFNENPFGLDLFGLGSYLIYLTGKTFYNMQELHLHGFEEQALNTLDERDFSMLFKNRVANLRKLYPYIPEALNRVLLHFSSGAEVFYETVDELLADLRPCLEQIRQASHQENNP